jgi:transcription antitermination protein NusB
VISPQQRRKARGRAVEFLFGLEFTRYDWRECVTEFFDTFATKPAVQEYAEGLIVGVKTRTGELDRHIDASLQNWTPDRVGRIERNVLRIALFEMIYGDNVPVKVAINEAIEVAKAYGSDDSPGFVNAVLDRLKDRDLEPCAAVDDADEPVETAEAETNSSVEDSE